MLKYNKQELDTTYVKKAKSYAMQPGVLGHIREKMLGLGPRVETWPRAYKGWESISRPIKVALERSGAARSQDSDQVLKKFINAYVQAQQLPGALASARIKKTSLMQAGFRDGALCFATTWAKVQDVAVGGVTSRYVYLNLEQILPILHAAAAALTRKK